MSENEISKIVFECGLKIHRKIGIGLFESIYEDCLYYELQKSGLKVEKQKFLDIVYDELILPKAFKMDLLVEDKVVLELKSVESLNSSRSSVEKLFEIGKLQIGNVIEFQFSII